MGNARRLSLRVAIAIIMGSFSLLGVLYLWEDDIGRLFSIATGAVAVVAIGLLLKDWSAGGSTVIVDSTIVIDNSTTTTGTGGSPQPTGPAPAPPPPSGGVTGKDFLLIAVGISLILLIAAFGRRISEPTPPPDGPGDEPAVSGPTGPVADSDADVEPDTGGGEQEDPSTGRLVGGSWTRLEAKPYRKPSTLSDWLRDAPDTVELAVPVELLNREVRVAEFGAYFAELPADEQARIGQRWRRTEDGDELDGSTPVAYLSHADVESYIEYLRQTTGACLRLPAYDEWLAGVMEHGDAQAAILRETAASREVPNPRSGRLDRPYDLLGNLREWLRDECDGRGHLTVGEAFLTRRDDIRGRRSCRQFPAGSVGFRLARDPLCDRAR